MSKIRRMTSTLSILALMAIAGLGTRVWQRSRPEYQWNQAHTALDAGDLAAARIHLQRLLHHFPEHGEGHQAMAQLCLQEAAQAGSPVGYAGCSEALEHLVRAAELLDDDLDLQKEVVAACLTPQPRLLSQGAAAAGRVRQAEPDNADALFLLACQAVAAHQADAASSLLALLTTGTSCRPFETYAMRAAAEGTLQRAAQANQILSDATRFASQLESAQIRNLSRREQKLMLQVLELAVARSADAGMAQRRAAEAITGLERVTAIHGRMVPTAAQTAARILAAVARQSAGPAGGAADEATGTAEPIAMQLAARVERLRAAAIAAGDSAPIVYLQSAEEAFRRGDSEAGLAILDRGLAAAQRQDPIPRHGILDLHLAAARRLVALERFAQADVHIQALGNDKDGAGWAHQLAGAIALEQGDFKAARDHLLQARLTLGEIVPVRKPLAQACLGLAQWQEALVYLATLHRSAAPAADPEEARVHFEELRAHLGLNDWKTALTHLEALKGSSQEPAGEAAAIAWLKGNRQEEQAVERLATARLRFPASPDVLRYELIRLQNTGRVDEARALVQRCAAAAPDDLACQLLLCQWRGAHREVPQSLAELDALEQRLGNRLAEQRAIRQTRVQVLQSAGRLKDAATALATLARGPQRAELALAQGTLEVAAGDFTASLEHLVQSLESPRIRPLASQTLLRCVLLQSRQAPPPEIDQRLDAMIGRFPDEPALLLAKAFVQFQQNKFHAGVTLLDRVKCLDANNPLVPLIEGEQWLRQGEHEHALACLQRVLKRDPEHPLALLLAGQAQLLSQRYQAALGSATQVLARYPARPEAIVLQAAALHGLQQHAAARDLLEDLLRNQPKYADGYRWLARAWAADGQREKALEVCVQGRKRVPDSPALALEQVRWLAELGRLDEARQVARQAGSDKPDATFCLEVVKIFRAKGQAAIAREWGERAEAVTAEWEKPAIRSFLGNLALGQISRRPTPRNSAEARDHYAAIVAADPKNLIAANNLAWLLATEFHQPQEAARILEEALAPPTAHSLPSEAAHTLAVVYRLNQRFDDARRVLNEALAKQPDEPLLLLELGTILAQTKRHDEAAAVLQRALQAGLEEKDASEARRLLERIRAGNA